VGGELSCTHGWIENCHFINHFWPVFPLADIASTTISEVTLESAISYTLGGMDDELMYSNFAMKWTLILLVLLVMGGEVQGNPNVILIYSDDQGAVDLNCFGARDLVTPNLDALAGRGIRFTQFYAAPVCSPSRASLLTGLTAQRAGVAGNAGGTAGLPNEKFTMAEMFKAAGYRTAQIGKWHLGMAPEMQPNAQGFDHSFGHLGGCIDSYSHFFYWSGPNRHDLQRNGNEVHYPGRFFPDLMVEETVRFIKKRPEDPFFIYFAINSPHYPYQGDPEWLEYYKKQGVPYPRDLYAAFISTMDEKIGTVLDFLKAEGLADSTIVIFQADNGYSTEERAHFGGGNSGSYRGAKACLFEGGIRVPAIISWPGKIPEGEVRSQFAVNTDWMPTLAALCGIPLDAGSLDGKSLVSIIHNANAETAHAEGYCWAFKTMWVARKEKWKVIGNPYDSGRPDAVFNEPLFLVDLEMDPGETTNLAGKYPEKVKELETQYKKWVEDSE